MAKCGRTRKAGRVACYQQPDTETLLAVMSEERKVRDAALASAKS